MFIPMRTFKVHSRQQHNTQITSEKLSVILIFFSSHNRNHPVFVPDAVAVIAVVNSTSICGCETLCGCNAVAVMVFDPSLLHIYIHNQTEKLELGSRTLLRHFYSKVPYEIEI